MSDALPELDERATLPFGDIPHFPVTEVAGHRGELVWGKLAGKSVLAMLGRFHYYEGYTMRGATFPVRVMAALGIENLIITNAAGGLNRRFQVGDFMLVADHINLMGSNPLIGPNDDELGPRFVDMSEAYDPQLTSLAESTGRRCGVACRKGVLAAVSGPSYETPAEIKGLFRTGADAVTMSTVPEVIVARHANIKALAISLITNIAGRPEKLTHEEVLEVAGRSVGNLKEWLKEILAAL